jgi:hypothetical protein
MGQGRGLVRTEGWGSVVFRITEGLRSMRTLKGGYQIASVSYELAAGLCGYKLRGESLALIAQAGHDFRCRVSVALNPICRAWEVVCRVGTWEPTKFKTKAI